MTEFLNINLQEFVGELLTFGISRKYTSLSHRVMRDKLGQYFGWLRVCESLGKGVSAKINVSPRASRPVDITCSNRGEVLVSLSHCPHILDPTGHTFKWKQGDERLITTGVLETTTFLLYYGGFFNGSGRGYYFDLPLSSLPQEEFQAYEKDFSLAYNCFNLLKTMRNSPEHWRKLCHGFRVEI